MGKLKQLLIDQDTELEDYPRGAGNPDIYGYPGEPVIKSAHGFENTPF